MDEKEILRMIDLQKNHCESQRIGDCVDKDCNDCSARVFYNAGYRKESDTAKEICEKVIALYRQVMPLQKKGLFIAENAFICGVREIEKYFAEDKE